MTLRLSTAFESGGQTFADRRIVSPRVAAKEVAACEWLVTLAGAMNDLTPVHVNLEKDQDSRCVQRTRHAVHSGRAQLDRRSS